MARALLVIDVQNDFVPGGALGVPRGDEVVPVVNELARSGRYDLVVATRDWHPPDHGSFAEHGGPWPRHCVQGTAGAELHPDVDRDALDVVLDKGQDAHTEGYSAFEATGLAELLRERGIDAVDVVGLAADVCVKHSALDALREGFQVKVDPTGTRGVEAEPGDTERAFEELRAGGAEVASSRRHTL